MNQSGWYKELCAFVKTMECCVLIDNAYVLHAFSCLLQPHMRLTCTA